jgi:hypothetical protein
MEEQINSIINVQDFLEKIEEIAAAKRMETLDAVLYYCAQTGLEIETAAELIKKNAKMKAKVRVDAESAGYFPKTAKLPI